MRRVPRRPPKAERTPNRFTCRWHAVGRIAALGARVDQPAQQHLGGAAPPGPLQRVGAEHGDEPDAYRERRHGGAAKLGAQPDAPRGEQRREDRRVGEVRRERALADRCHRDDGRAAPGPRPHPVHEQRDQRHVSEPAGRSGERVEAAQHAFLGDGFGRHVEDADMSQRAGQAAQPADGDPDGGGPPEEAQVPVRLLQHAVTRSPEPEQDLRAGQPERGCDPYEPQPRSQPGTGGGQRVLFT